MIQWTTPLMLLGMGLLTLPVIAHLLNRHSRDVFVVPTIRFLKQSSSQQNRFLNLKRWLLLLLRLAAMALLVSMFARPVWWQNSAPDTVKDSVAMVVVLDASMSTSRQVENVILFDKMKAATIRALNELETGRDVANVVIARGVPKTLLRRPTLNTEELKRQLELESWSYQQADLRTAIAEAVAQLANHQGQKTIAIVSDWQKTNWNDFSSSSPIAIPNDINVRLIDLKVNNDANVGLSSATCQPSDPVDGQKVQLSVEVSNYSNETRQVPVQLLNGSKTLGEQQIRIAAGQSQVAVFAVEFDSQRMREFTFKTNRDSLPVDDVAYAATYTPQAAPITVITDDPPNETGTATYFLERAILPFNSDADRFSVQTLAVSDVQDNRLAGQKMVVVGYVTQWNSVAAKSLIEFVRSGGKLLYLCGEGDVANQLRQIESLAGEAFFPFQLTRLNRFKRFEKTLYVSSGKWRSRWLRDFDFQSQIALGEVRFQNVWGTTQPQSDADIILQYADDRPTVGVRNFGKGTIVLANLSPAISFSEFGKFGAFAALTQILIRGLVDEDETAKQKFVGDPIVFSLPKELQPQDQDWSLTGPGDSDAPAIMSESANGSRSVLVNETNWPGLYRLSVGKKWSQTVAIEVNRDESDLTSLQPEQIQELMSDVESQTASSDGFSINLLEKGSPLWGKVALVALGLLSLESLLLGWWKR